MPTVYPQLVRRLQGFLEDYQAKRVSVSDLQTAVSETAEAVVSLEDRELRNCLLWAEGKLELLRFTTEKPDLFSASLEVVAVVEEKIRTALLK